MCDVLQLSSVCLYATTLYIMLKIHLIGSHRNMDFGTLVGRCVTRMIEHYNIVFLHSYISTSDRHRTTICPGLHEIDVSHEILTL